MNATIAIAAFLGLLLTIAGALGAHQVPATSPQLMASWNSALLFGLIHSLAAIFAAILAPARPLARYAGWSFLIGVVAFSFNILISVAYRANSLTGDSTIATAEANVLAPMGGAAFMIGWAMMVIASLRDKD